MLRIGGFDVHSHVKSPYPKTKKCAGSKPWKYSSGWKNVRVASAMVTRITSASAVEYCIRIAALVAAPSAAAECQQVYLQGLRLFGGRLESRLKTHVIPNSLHVIDTPSDVRHRRDLDWTRLNIAECGLRAVLQRPMHCLHFFFKVTSSELVHCLAAPIILRIKQRMPFLGLLISYPVTSTILLFYDDLLRYRCFYALFCAGCSCPASS